MKKTTPSYILTLQLKTKKFQEDIINKRMEICRKIYNCLVTEFYKRYNHMRQSKEYNKTHKQIINNYRKINIKTTLSKKEEYKNIKKQLKLEIKVLQNQNKELYKLQNDMYIKYGIDKSSLSRFLTPIKKHFENNIDSHVSQKVLENVWKSIDKFLYSNGKKVYYKSYGELNSLEGKWNKSGLRYNEKTGYLNWNKLNISVIIKKNDVYAQKAIQDRIKYCRIKREMIKGRYHYYIQLVLEGIPPQKINKETGEIKGQIGFGRVGIDNGTSTTAICSKYKVMLVELVEDLNNIEHKKYLMQRKMDRSRRMTNPNKYNKNGTINTKNKSKWIYSKKYINAKNQLKELNRKQRVIRKQCHYKLINGILPLGNEFYVETMNYKGLQSRSKKTTKNSKGKFNKKKRFGKSLANKAPAMFLSMLNQKLHYFGLELNKINTQKVKASQYNHFTDEYNKKELKDRWNIFNINDNKIRIQRDMYSAFLIMNVNDNLESINRELCFETYDNFKILHDKEINRLKNTSNKKLSSMGL